jgi:hypothetical protein
LEFNLFKKSEIIAFSVIWAHFFIF